MTPAEEIALAAQRLTVKQPYGQVSDRLADLLYAIAGEMDSWEYGVIEGSASRKVHPGSPLGLGLMEPRDDWTAVLAVARVVNGDAS